jgi:hypothetical protein
MVTEFENRIEFGLDIFAASSELLNCTVGIEVLLDVALQNAENINHTIASSDVGGATPLYLGIQNYTDPAYAPLFSRVSGEKYLVILSDGGDTCGTGGTSILDLLGATPTLMTELTKQLLNEQDIRTIVIGFGDGVEARQLNAIAASGGTPYTEYLIASNGDELTSVLQEIAQNVAIGCEYDIGEQDPDEVNLDFANFYFDGVPVPRDDDCEVGTGWSWTDSARRAIRFCGSACTRLKSGGVTDISGEIACSIHEVIIV